MEEGELNLKAPFTSKVHVVFAASLNQDQTSQNVQSYPYSTVSALMRLSGQK